MQAARAGWTEKRKAEIAAAAIAQRQEASYRAQLEREEAMREKSESQSAKRREDQV